MANQFVLPKHTTYFYNDIKQQFLSAMYTCIWRKKDRIMPIIISENVQKKAVTHTIVTKPSLYGT